MRYAPMPLALAAVGHGAHPISRPAPPRAARAVDGGARARRAAPRRKRCPRLASHGTDVGGALITDAPPLALHQPYDRVFRERAAGHQGPRPCRALPATCRTTQPFAVLGRPGPRPM